MSQTTSRIDVDPSSQPQAPSLVQRVVSRDPVGLTFLLQLCLCAQAVEMTSSWGHHQELAILESVYKRLFASGEHPITVAKQYFTYASKMAERSALYGGCFFKASNTVFDGARTINEFGSDSFSALGSRDRIVGTTEVGVGKSTSGRAGKVII